MAEDEYTIGYREGWQSILPGAIPSDPSYALSGMKSAYEQGFDAGVERAREWSGKNDGEPK